MIRRPTWIVLGVFAVLVLGVFLWQRYGVKEESVEPTPTTALISLVFDLGDQTIASYQILDAQGNSISFGHDPTSNVWVVKDQPAELAYSTQIETVAGNLAFLLVDTALATQPPLDSMGLDHPSYSITLFLDNGEQSSLHVGNVTPTGSGYYARVDDGPAMVIAKTDVDVVINLLKTPPLAATYTPTVTPTMTSTATMTATSTLMPTTTSTSTPEMTSEPEMTSTPTP